MIYGIILMIAVALFICGFFIGKKAIQKENYEISAQIQTDEEILKIKQNQLKEQNETLEQAIKYKRETLESLNEDCKKKKEEDNKLLQSYYEEKKQLLDEKISSEYDLQREKLKQNIAELTQKENLRLSKNLEKNRLDFETKSEKYALELEDCQKALEEMRAKQIAAIEAAKHEEEIKKKSDFYRLQITRDAIEDISELKKIERRLHQKEVLNKLIYKTYFEKAYTDLVGRVVGKTQKTGIYKITNLNNNRVYVGQAVNIAERWKQHIKRALGAEPMTKNKLYPAMAEEGVWNFTFEVIEECEKTKLNSREQYWQDFFGAKEFGYSIK